MAGGTWEAQNKVRPGVYINFRTAESNTVSPGERGIVAIAKALPWGEFSTFFTVGAGTDTVPGTGYPLTDPHNLFLQQMFLGTNRTRGAREVILYRLPTTGNASATATVGNLTVTAKYAGTRGNGISFTVEASLEEEGSFNVSVFVDGTEVDSQLAATVADLGDNEWVTFSGTGELSETEGTALAGGLDGTVSATGYSAFLNALETQTFDVVVYDGSDTLTQSAMVSFAKRMYEESGKIVQLVTANATAPDSQYVVNNASGATLSDGTALTAQQVTWWLGGATAGAKYNESLTYAVYPGAVSISPGLTNEEYVAGIQAGKFMLFDRGDGLVRVETDINSLTTYTEETGAVYRKNRVMRLCATISKDVQAQWTANYIGVTPNNENGRALFRAALVAYIEQIQNDNGIQNFDASDVTVEAGAEPEAVVVNLAIQPVDAIEKIYMTVVVG